MYKPLQTVDWYHTEANKTTPQSTTQEMLQMGRANRQNCIVSKKLFNFQSFNFGVSKVDRPKELPLTTSYKRDYAAPYDYICVSQPFKETTADRLWNRKPLNDFGLERVTSSEFKFMDDHLINITPERQKINYFRQLRNQHYPLV